MFINYNDNKPFGIAVETPVGMSRVELNKKFHRLFFFFVLKVNNSLVTRHSHEENEKSVSINFREVQDYECSSFKT